MTSGLPEVEQGPRVAEYDDLLRQPNLVATRRGETQQAASAAIDSVTRVLRLPTIQVRFEEMTAA